MLPSCFAEPDLELAVEDLISVYPTTEAYHADPVSERNRIYTGDEYGAIIP